MKYVVIENGPTLGPFEKIEQTEEGLDCGNVFLSFAAIGTYALADTVSLTYSDDDLAPARAAKNEEINRARAAANQTYFTYKGMKIACDPLSRSDIDGTNGAVLLSGSFPPGWPGGWKTVDNSFVGIATVDEWKAFYTAMWQQGAMNFAKAQGLKTQLAAAKTPEEISAIAW